METIKDYKDLLSFLDSIHLNWPKAPFRPSEFFLSSTADKLGISNFPDDPEVLINLLKLINNILVPVRKRINMPIIILPVIVVLSLIPLSVVLHTLIICLAALLIYIVLTIKRWTRLS